MKQIVLILFLLVSAYAHDPYWVQVIAVKKPASLTAGFMGKVDEYSKHHVIIHKDGYSKVLLGFFPHFAQAKNAKSYFQKMIAKDAFIVTHSINNNKASQKMVQITTKKIDLTKNKTVTQQSIAKVQMPATVQELNATKKEVMNCASLCDGKKRREDEIASAIEFYRHSSLYKFSKASTPNF